MTEPDADEVLADARRWWHTDIIDIHPGEIALRGYPTTRVQAELLEAALVSSVDHGPQAPSIAIARMAVTCGTAINGAMASAVNVLDDIHGGPGQECMRVYAEIDREWTTGGDVATAAAAVIERRRAAGEKYVPGFGHRFHPLDPRTPRLLELIDAAVADGSIGGRFAVIGRAVEDVISAGRPRRIPMNVDGATAVVYSEIGLPPELGRGVFILARSVGILAHAWEQMVQGGRIKGPVPKTIGYTYTGPARRSLSHTDDETRRTS
jgi:citrate synthase